MIFFIIIDRFIYIYIILFYAFWVYDFLRVQFYISRKYIHF